MIIIFFADQTKRPNSTKQPSANGQAYDVILKEGCSIERPVIGLKWPGSGSPVSYNAARIAVFHRWYTVENWTFEDRIWWATLAVDVLATYKTEIGASTKYILRSASDSDDDVLDTIYPAKGVQHSAMTFLLNTPVWARTYSAGRFVVGITGQGNTFASGGVGYIVCTPSQFQSLLDGAYTGADSLWPLDLGPTIGEAMAVYGKKLQQSLQKPFQYINSVTWVPFVPTTSGSTTVTLGKISTGVTCDTLATPITEFLWTETLNSQPAGAGTPVWKNIAPYARYVLQIPPFGTHDLDSTLLPGKTTLQFELHVDVTNGEAHLDVNASGGGGVTPLISISAKMGINIPIAGIVTDQAGFLGSVVGAVGSLAGAIIAPSAGSITGAASGIGNAVQSAQPYVVGGGQPGGGLAALNGQQAITYIVYEPVDEDNTEHGRPLCKVDQISNYSGYLMLADGDVEIPGTAAERAQVASLLTGGFFYE